ncbi:MAG: hypothetical protein Q9174_006400 [Haloplaca sp. 1 TL-2023]
MADPLSISLRAWPPEDKTTESLPYLIARINEQKGSFRNVTEASLQEEIDAGADETEAADDDEEPSGTAEDAQDIKAKQDDLFKAREKMIKQIGEARDSSSHALDLISLLLANHLPKAAQNTVTPFIKAAIPFGSLSAEALQQSQPSAADKATEDIVGLGWRMRSLTQTADVLLSSASRLEQEIQYETTYWQEVLAVKEAGWSHMPSTVIEDWQPYEGG